MSSPTDFNIEEVQRLSHNGWPTANVVKFSFIVQFV